LTTFLLQLLRSYSCAKKLQSQTVTKEKHQKTLLYKKVRENVGDIDTSARF